MADPGNQLEREQRVTGGSSAVAEFTAPPGVSSPDAEFLAELWTELRDAEHPRYKGDREAPLDPTEIQTLIEASLRATPEVAAYKQSLQRLARAHPGAATDAEAHARQLGFFANTQDHFLWLMEPPKSVEWRVYLAPTPASAPDLLASLHGRLQAPDVPANVGMKVSAYDGLRRCRDGLVIYAANQASLKAVLTAVQAEAAANPGRFTRDILRFTRPLLNGVAGLAPDPQSRAHEWRSLVESWAASNQDWVKGRTVAWNTNPQHMSYTMLLGSVLTTCYLLALAKSPARTQSRSGQVSEFQARPLYEKNVSEAFRDLGINPSTSSLGAPSLSGVGWLRYRFF
jgi:hypothetical protein